MTDRRLRGEGGRTAATAVLGESREVEEEGWRGGGGGGGGGRKKWLFVA